MVSSIDFNDNGAFDAAEIVYNNNTIRQSSHTGNIHIPSGGVDTNKILRLRVISDYNPITGGCYTPTYGEIEDYGVMVPSSP